MIRRLSDLPIKDQIRFRLLSGHFERIQRQLRYVDYTQAERDSEVLAERLVASCSRSYLNEVTFLAIPRGALIVLGMLAYWLDLRPEQVSGGDPGPKTPVCVVDDCALTGLRFSQVLASTKSESVAFAHLYSPPAVRAAILEREPRVHHCVAARDIEAFREGESQLLRERAAAGRRPLEEQQGAKRYAVEMTAMVGFPWSEPDTNITDPISGLVESHWRFVPPHRCLKNLTALGLPPHGERARSWIVPPDLVWGLFGDLVWLVKPAHKQAYRLDGINAEMWRALAASGDVDTTVDFLQERHQDTRGAGQLTRFVDELLAEGLILMRE